jgi:hypothetical protein
MTICLMMAGLLQKPLVITVDNCQLRLVIYYYCAKMSSLRGMLLKHFQGDPDKAGELFEVILDGLQLEVVPIGSHWLQCIVLV